MAILIGVVSSDRSGGGIILSTEAGRSCFQDPGQQHDDDGDDGDDDE